LARVAGIRQRACDAAESILAAITGILARRLRGSSLGAGNQNDGANGKSNSRDHLGGV
jgi:hypothetical protein